MAGNQDYIIPTDCDPGPKPAVACAQTIPRKIIKINRFTGQLEISQFVFVGEEHFTNDILREIFNKIELNETLGKKDKDILEPVFGPEYTAVLGINNDYPKQFIPEYLEIDDTIDIIKGKIQLHLNPDKYKSHMPKRETQMPVSLQYLWAPNCYRESSTNQRTTVDIEEKSLGFSYYYNLTPDEISNLIDDLEGLQRGSKTTLQKAVLKGEIQKLRLYQEDLLTRKKTRRRRLAEAITVEDYQYINLYPADPFLEIKDDPTDYNDVLDRLFVEENGNISKRSVLEDQHDRILQDYPLTNLNTLNLLNLIDFLDYLKEKTAYKDYLEKGVIPNLPENIYFHYFVDGYLRKYWPRRPLPEPRATEHFDLDNIVLEYINTSSAVFKKALISQKQIFEVIVERAAAEKAKINVIHNDEIQHGINFSSCRILEVVIHVNYMTYSPEYVDLLKVFDLYPLSEEVPHVKYRGDTPEESFHKVFTEISAVIPKDELTRWVSDKPVKTKAEAPETIKYTVFGKGLSYKVKLYELPNPDPKNPPIPKYGTLILLKDGKIELKASWDESLEANLENLKTIVTKFKEVVQEFNKLPFHLKGSSRSKK